MHAFKLDSLWIISVCAVMIFVSCKRSKKSLDEIEKEAFGVFESSGLTIKGVPLDESDAVDLDIEVKDENTLGYYYKLGMSKLIDCSVDESYIYKASNTNIKKNIASLPDGKITLCVAPVEKSGINLSAVFETSWTKITRAESTATTLKVTAEDKAMKTSWEAIEGIQGYLLAFSLDPIDWFPESETEYEKGQIIGEVKIAYIGSNSDALVSGLENNKAYYFSIFTYDGSYNYKHAANASGIVSKFRYAWQARKESMLTQQAIASGHLENKDTKTFICRSVMDAASSKYYLGQFVPSDANEISQGTCRLTIHKQDYYLKDTEDYEILSMAAGYEENEVFSWSSAPQDLFLAGIFDGHDRSGTAIANVEGHICRFSNPDTKELQTGVYTKAFGACEVHTDKLSGWIISTTQTKVEYLTLK